MKSALTASFLLLPLAAQSPTYLTFGSALSVQTNFAQAGFSAAATCNGVSGGSSWVLGPGNYDAWAVAPNTGSDNYCAWTFRGGSRLVSSMQLRSDYGFVGTFNFHYVRDFALDFTTDPVPQLNGNWQPLTILQVIPSGATMVGNVVTYPVSGYPNLDDCDVQFQPVQATGVRLHVFPQGGTGNGGNCVVSEVSFATQVPGFIAHGAASPCVAPRSATVNGVPRIGDTGFRWQAPQAPVNGLGLLFASTAPLPAAFPLLGIDIWISPVDAIGLTTATSSWGTAETAFPLPNNSGLIGFQVAGQYVWLESCAPAGLTASSAGSIVLQ